MLFEGKTAIVTGGAQGIGAAIVKKLVDRNAKIAVFDIAKDSLDAMTNNYPDVDVRECDVTNPEQVRVNVNDFFQRYGRIDVLINCAGFVYNAPLFSPLKKSSFDFDIEMWNKTIGANLTSVYLMSRNVVEKMAQKRTRGVIVNISSICSYGNAGQSAYSAAKAGVDSLTVTWAKELGAFGIRVAGISPGFVTTQNCLNSMNEEIIEDWKRKTPAKRMAEPDEIANAVIFVIENDFFNGRILEVDGGLRI